MERANGEDRRFADWVKQNEPTTYTYCVLVREAPLDQPDAEVEEVIMYERYRDAGAVKEHGAKREFKDMFKQILPHIHPKKTRLAEWEELGFSFAGEEGARQREGEEARLAAKL